MLEVLIGGSRFEADEVKVDGAGFGECQAESALGGDDFGVGLRVGLCASNSQFGAKLGPFAASIGGGCGHDSGSGLPSSPISATCTGSALPWARVQMEKS